MKEKFVLVSFPVFRSRPMGDPEKVTGKSTSVLLTLLQLPVIEVGNAVRADCYSIASYPSTCL